MTTKRVAILAGLLLASVGCFGQPSITHPTSTYPTSKGVVSDYAGRLTKDQVSELTVLLQQYERKTSIEFVVVVANSLQGQSAREYAIGLGDAWGVGKVDRDNGIVLLWAPNERAYSLRIADGLKTDVTDADARRITQQSLLPNFKSGRYYAGLKDTVVATMTQLGDQSWDNRTQGRAQAEERERQAEEQRRQEQARREEESQRIYMGVLFGLPIVALTAFAVYKSRQHRKKLAELAQANAAIAENLAKAETNAPQIQQLLDDFSKEAPEQDLSALRSEQAAQPDRIVKLKLDATLLDFADLKSYDEMVRIRGAAEAEAGVLETIQEKIASIRTAKQQSQALMDQLSKENFAISDLRDASRKNEIDEMLLRSRQDYELARQNSSMSVVNWLLINEMLSRSRSQAQQAVVYSQEEPYVPSPSYSGDSSNSSSGGFFGSSDSGSSSFDSSSSSSSDGGGGGFSGGSGSDGSY